MCEVTTREEVRSGVLEIFQRLITKGTPALEYLIRESKHQFPDNPEREWAIASARGWHALWLDVQRGVWHYLNDSENKYVSESESKRTGIPQQEGVSRGLAEG